MTDIHRVKVLRSVRLSHYSLSFKRLCNLCVLCVSAVIGVKAKTARGAENAEAAQRLEALPFLLKSFNLEILSEKFMTDR